MPKRRRYYAYEGACRELHHAPRPQNAAPTLSLAYGFSFKRSANLPCLACRRLLPALGCHHRRHTRPGLRPLAKSTLLSARYADIRSIGLIIFARYL